MVGTESSPGLNERDRSSQELSWRPFPLFILIALILAALLWWQGYPAIGGVVFGALLIFGHFSLPGRR